MENANGPYYEPFDAAGIARMIEEVWFPIMDHYFRPMLIGAGKLPASGPLILAGNHSGTAFPYDAMVLDTLLWRREGMNYQTKFRSVFEKELAANWWMRPFGVDNFWRRGGGVDATFDNFDVLLARGERVIYYPEGVPGIGKGFNNRYRLQRFSSSFVIMAARYQAPVYPVYIINAEWVIPFQYTFRPIDRFMERVFGVPFLPLPAAPFAITFPWAWYLALPARMIFVIGEPIDVAAMVRAEGVERLDKSESPRLRAIAEKVRLHMQAELDHHVKRYGRWPYQARKLWQEWIKARGKRGRVWPPGWPVAFLRYERDRRRPPARSRLHAVLRDWDLIGYYIPLGWPLLSLARRLRRPPYGYRGLSAEQAREQEGRFVWNLRERPLPPKTQEPTPSS